LCTYKSSFPVENGTPSLKVRRVALLFGKMSEQYKQSKIPPEQNGLQW
jgi:hypothetical protein